MSPLLSGKLAGARILLLTLYIIVRQLFSTALPCHSIQLLGAVVAEVNFVVRDIWIIIICPG
ncbi:hypothetical protein THS27_18455 [Thalassospira sp. MCCC 1A01428]|nr:hypothetical protein THS27_18455 [Thalassospira sp. MCCC 1A01428]